MQTFPGFSLSCILLSLLLAACSGAGTIAVDQPVAENTVSSVDNRDLSCAYFYFLWGSHAEFDNRLEDAMEAYEKALVCDPSAEYIEQKLPLLWMKKGDTEQARTLLENAIGAHPEDTARRALLASIYIQQQQHQLAIEQYREIIDYDPENGQILLRLGALLSQLGDYDEARSILNRLVDLDQETYLAHLYLARVATRQNETAAAIEHYQAALRLNWSAELAYELADFYQKTKLYQEAIDTLRTALDDNEADEQARLGIVQALLAQEREEEAIAELGLARQFSSSPERLSVVISRLYLRIGQPDKAIDNLRAVLDNTESSEARYLLAVVFAEQQRFPEALALIDRIAPDDQEFEDAVFLKTKILHETKRTAEALQMLEDFLETRPTDKPMLLLLAASLNRDQGNDEHSLALLADAAQRFPADEQVLFAYGLELERSNRLDEAIEVMESIIVLNPDHAEALNFVGYCWADAERNLDQALSYINRAMALKPGNGYIQDSLGWVHFRLGNFERAERELLGALELLPDDPHINEHLGDLYQALGQPGKARTFYDTAFEKFDDDTKKQAVRKKIDELDNP
ncbi:MAG: tetratricopeptide repeat protein [Desulfofustis sp.]|nr:tetratricopeptide repeat protein [Desulfofustis sp.]